MTPSESLYRDTLAAIESAPAFKRGGRVDLPTLLHMSPEAVSGSLPTLSAKQLSRALMVMSYAHADRAREATNDAR